MQDMILYLLMAAFGYFIGSHMRSKKDKLLWTPKVQTCAITVLLFVMGLRIGSNDEVIENISSIGIYALIVTAIIMSSAVFFIYVGRRLMGFNKRGLLGFNKRGLLGKDDNLSSLSEEPSESARGNKIDKMTIIILICVALGMLMGFLFVKKIFPDYEVFSSLAGTLIRVGLCILLWFVGLDLGIEGTVIGNLKAAGIKVLILPMFNILGTFVGAAICALILPLSLREMMAIGAGFGWYTLAPGIIMDAGYVTASAISFMHNVLRELLAILLIPLVAKKIGGMEAVGLPGAAAMDVCLPIVERSAGSQLAVFSFLSGVILTIVVPILVPLFVS